MIQVSPHGPVKGVTAQAREVPPPPVTLPLIHQTPLLPDQLPPTLRFLSVKSSLPHSDPLLRGRGEGLVLVRVLYSLEAGALGNGEKI